MTGTGEDPGVGTAAWAHGDTALWVCTVCLVPFLSSRGVVDLRRLCCSRRERGERAGPAGARPASGGPGGARPASGAGHPQQDDLRGRFLAEPSGPRSGAGRGHELPAAWCCVREGRLARGHRPRRGPRPAGWTPRSGSWARQSQTSVALRRVQPLSCPAPAKGVEVVTAVGSAAGGAGDHGGHQGKTREKAPRDVSVGAGTSPNPRGRCLNIPQHLRLPRHLPLPPGEREGRGEDEGNKLGEQPQ